MMEPIIARLRGLWRAFTRIGALRSWLIATGGAALLLALVISVILTLGAPTTETRARVAPTASTAPTVTSAPTYTATVRPTATRKPSKPHKSPPPPPPPPPPPATTPSSGVFPQFCPTPTAPAATPTATSAPTATAVATATATAGETATATTASAATGTSSATGGATHSAGFAAMANCVNCPYYAGNNPSQSQIAAALVAAARLYGLPANLLKAVAWQESRWHEDVYSCDGGIGLMQIQYYTYPWLNGQAVPACGLGVTNYDPKTLQGNANLGAKYLKYLSCFYAYWGNNGTVATLANPGPYTIDWYYQQVGLPFPDAYTASGALAPTSFCAAVFNANSYYRNLPSSLHDAWDCPYTATTGDATLLDITLSAYNEGADYTDQNGIQNWWYVGGVEGWVSQFASGALPVAS